jgi:hypothetical protein
MGGYRNSGETGAGPLSNATGNEGLRNNQENARTREITEFAAD